MEAAFLSAGVFPPPAACPEFLTRFDRARARCASDAGIAAVVKSVVRKLVLSNVCPHVIPCPVDQGIELVQPIAFIPFLKFQCVPGIGLLVAKSGDPCLL